MAVEDLTADEARRRSSLPGAFQMLASTRGSHEHHQVCSQAPEKVAYCQAVNC